MPAAHLRLLGFTSHWKLEAPTFSNLQAQSRGASKFGASAHAPSTSESPKCSRGYWGHWQRLLKGFRVRHSLAAQQSMFSFKVPEALCPGCNSLRSVTKSSFPPARTPPRPSGQWHGQAAAASAFAAGCLAGRGPAWRSSPLRHSWDQAWRPGSGLLPPLCWALAWQGAPS